jgi:hypothetical protein
MTKKRLLNTLLKQSDDYLLVTKVNVFNPEAQAFPQT